MGQAPLNLSVDQTIHSVQRHLTEPASVNWLEFAATVHQLDPTCPGVDHRVALDELPFLGCGQLQRNQNFVNSAFLLLFYSHFLTPVVRRIVLWLRRTFAAVLMIPALTDHLATMLAQLASATGTGLSGGFFHRSFDSQSYANRLAPVDHA